MLYYLITYLEEQFQPPGFQAVQFITVRAALAAITALAITLFVGRRIINWLGRQQVGELVREGEAAGAVDHSHKAGTPTMGGVIILLFLIFHLADLTFGYTNPDFVSGDVYNNIVTSFQSIPVAVIYIVAQVFLALHIYHGAWSLFQSLGLANPRFNEWRRWFAVAFALIILIGNTSMVLAVQVGYLTI